MKHLVKVIHFEYDMAIEGDWQAVHRVQNYDCKHPIQYHENGSITESHLVYLQRGNYHFFINISLEHAQHGNPSSAETKSQSRRSLPELYIREQPIVELLQTLPHKKKLAAIIQDFINDYQLPALHKKPRCAPQCMIM